MPSERTGSYPLMNLAADYGVDYGDVLLVAQQLRSFKAGVRPTRERKAQAMQAADRIMKSAGTVTYGLMVETLARRL